MGKRTQALIGTMDGVATVRVYSANPKTADGCNTLIFRRELVKETQLHAIRSTVEIAAVSVARGIASTMVHICGAPNEEVCRKNGVRFFEYGLQRVRLNEDLYLVLGEVGVKANSRPYYDQRIVAKFKADSEASSIQGHMHIGESAFEQIYDNRFRLILQGVELYYQKMVEYAV